MLAQRHPDLFATKEAKYALADLSIPRCPNSTMARTVSFFVFVKFVGGTL